MPKSFTKAIVDANMSFTKKSEEVEIININALEDTALIKYPNGYTENMMLTALTLLN